MHSIQITAKCDEDCSSDRDFDVTTCFCENADFPNNWVTCTDGSDAMDNYSPFDEQYIRLMLTKGAVALRYSPSKGRGND